MASPVCPRSSQGKSKNTWGPKPVSQGRYSIPPVELTAGMRVQVNEIDGQLCEYNGRRGTVIKIDEKASEVVVVLDPIQMKKCLPLVHSTSKLGKDVVEVSPSSLQLVLCDGSLAACWDGTRVGLGCLHKRVKVRHDGEPRFGIAPAAIEMRPPPPSPATVRVELDIGVRVLIPRARVEEPTALNSRAWIVCSPVMHAYTRESNCSPEGTYPVYVSTRCVTSKFGQVLEAELRKLESTLPFDHYHDSEGKGNWRPRDGHHREKTLVRVLYGYDCPEGDLPCQNPCGGVQWSSSWFEPPYIQMPPATRFLSRLLRFGNPDLAAALGTHSHRLYACAAMTLYRHRNRVGSALDWHMDKSLGIETACVSVPRNSRGHKTVGISASALDEAPTLLQIEPNSVWWANAKAISHAVGNNDLESSTIIFRMLVPRSMYDWFYPNGARTISSRLHAVKRRFFPVLTAKDCDAFSKPKKFKAQGGSLSRRHAQ